MSYFCFTFSPKAFFFYLFVYLFTYLFIFRHHETIMKDNLYEYSEDFYEKKVIVNIDVIRLMH